MEAGRELDAAVGEKVMRWERASDGAPYFWRTPEMVADIRKQYPDALAVDYFPAPEFSTDFGHAWGVVEHMCRLDPPWFFSFRARDATHWEVEFDNGCYDNEGQLTGIGFDISGSVPLAICRAALRAIGTLV